MSGPRNIACFQGLLNTALMLEAVGIAFHDRTISPDMTDQDIAVVTMMSGALILLRFYLIWLVANHHKRWPLWVLLGGFVFAVLLMIQRFATAGVEFDSTIALLSAVLTGVGLYCAFTAEAWGWFDK